MSILSGEDHFGADAPTQVKAIVRLINDFLMESILRPNISYRIVPVLFGAVSVAGAAYFKGDSENFIYFLIFVFLVLLSIGAIAEGFVAKIELGETELIVKNILKQNKYKKEKIEKVTWEKGSGVSFMYEGNWVKLPNLGRDIQLTSNTIKKWLKK